MYKNVCVSVCVSFCNILEYYNFNVTQCNATYDFIITYINDVLKSHVINYYKI